MSITQSIKHYFVASVALSLAACGLPNGGGTNFGDPDRGTLPSEATLVTIPVNVEATASMMQQAAGSDAIFTADNISCSAISAIQLNYNMEEISAASLPDSSSVARSSNPSTPNAVGCQLEFVENFEPRLDAVIRVEYPNDDVLYAPLRRPESDDIPVVVSFGSHLVVKELFDQITTPQELTQHLPCEGSDPDCETQHRAKSRLLSFIADTARLYEYENDVQSTHTKSTAIALLEGKSDLMTHIETAVGEILRSESPVAKGTVRESYDTTENSDILNGVLQTRLSPSNTYNSVMFMMGLTQNTSEVTENRLMTASSHIEFDGSTETLPKLLHKAYYLDFRYDDILPTIPFEMSTLRFKTTNKSVSVEPTRDPNQLNYLTGADSDSSEDGSAVFGTHLSSQGFFLNDRAIGQTVTDAPASSSATTVGYDFNPVYYKLYRINEYEPDTSLDNLLEAEDPVYGDSPTWLTGTGYGLINMYELTQTGSNPVSYDRGDVLEKHRTFSWEVHGLRSSSDISASDISGEYDVIEFSIRLDSDPSADSAIRARAETLEWSVSGNSFVEDQPSAHYRTWELTRDRNNAFTSSTEQDHDSVDPDHPLGSRQFTLYTDSEDTPNGLIHLDGTNISRTPLGHVTGNGQHLAFAIDNSNNDDATRGIILASQRRTTPIDLSGDSLDFTLSGNTLFMDSDTHRLTSLNESRLSLSSSDSADCAATLTVNSDYVEHTLGSENTIAAPSSSDGTIVQSSSCSLTNGSVELGFTLNGEALTLRGFAVKEDGDLGKTVKLINLLWLQDNTLGLVFAQLDQDLSPTFDE